MNTYADLDLVIVGGGIGGIICLKYAKDAGLNALLLERRERIGGLWRDLPAWQDIQIRKEDWTLGDLPLFGEDQQNILRNIKAWVERFELAPYIRLNESVTQTRVSDIGWHITTETGEYEAKWLIAATGGHNIPVVPLVERVDSSITEYHSSALNDPKELRGKRVTVVGGGASAFDLLDLCFENGAHSVSWIYRSVKWMRPTRKPKYFAANLRLLAKFQMLGMPVSLINWLQNRELRAIYAKADLMEIMPKVKYDVSHKMLIPGRAGMIKNFRDIERHCGEVKSLRGKIIELSNSERMEAEVILWGTGYRVDLDYLGLESLSNAKSLNEISSRCNSVFLSVDAPKLFLLAPGVLETITSTPWAYAHVAKSIMTHISGRPVFVSPPCRTLTNFFDLVKLLARNDRKNYPLGIWYIKYFWLAMRYPWKLPLPLP